MISVRLFELLRELIECKVEIEITRGVAEIRSTRMRRMSILATLRLEFDVDRPSEIARQIGETPQ
jgi:hypothetical protein